MEDRSAALQTFQQLTHRSPEESIEILGRHNWNLLEALRSVGVTPPPTLQRQITAQSTSWLQFGWHLLSSAWRLGSNFLWSLFPQTTTHTLDPSTAATTFVTSFERQYGRVHPRFFQGSYTQAVARSRTELKLLIIYLHSDRHANTPRFCRNTLCNEAVVEMLDRNFILWAGDVAHPEGYKLSSLLGATTFPFIAVLSGIESGGVTPLERIEGPIPAAEFVDHLQSVLDSQEALLVAAQAQREERERDRILREQQDKEYQEALRLDQERERKAREEEQRRQEEERHRREAERREEEAKKRKHEERERKRAALPPEPPASASTAHVVVRMPDGTRLGRRFRLTDKLQVVYDFLDVSQDKVEIDKYHLASNFPRKIFTDLNTTLEEAKLFPQALLFIQEK